MDEGEGTRGEDGAKKAEEKGNRQAKTSRAGQQEGMKEGCDQKAVCTLDAISDPINQGANKCEV